MAKLNEMIKEFRESINQSPEAIAMMLQMSVDEYHALETDWIPPEELLRRMCTLFEWNFNEIKRIAQATPSVSGGSPRNMASPAQRKTPMEGGGNVPHFHQMLQEARITVGQSTAGIAMLLNIPVEYYESFEADTLPPEDMVKKICALFSWNYREIRQQLINQTTPKVVPRQRPLSLKDIRPHLPKPAAPPVPVYPEENESLGSRLMQARTSMGQSVAGIALLLDISEDYYMQLESGANPDPELLKKIAALFRWNYNELQLLIHNENIRMFQPSVTHLEVQKAPQLNKLQTLQKTIQEYYTKVSPQQQEMLISQLEVIRDTAKRWASS